MGLTQFWPHDPVPSRRSLKETSLAKPLTKNGFVATTVQTAIASMCKGDRFAYKLIDTNKH